MFWRIKAFFQDLQARSAEQQRQSKKSAASNAQLLKDNLKEELELQVKLQEYKEKYKCHVCGKLSDDPIEYESTPAIFDSSGSPAYTDWNNPPKNTTICIKCGEPTCNLHIHKIKQPPWRDYIHEGVCKTCIESS